MDKDLQETGAGAGSPGTPGDDGGRVIGRRRLLRAGASAAPVLLTLASGPVSAANGCVVASSFISATTFQSRNAGATKILNCASKTCEQWQSTCGSTGQPWSTYTATTTVATALGNNPSCTYNGWTLNAVLQQPLHTTDQLGTTQHTIAMFLNVKYNGSTFPGVSNSTTYLQGMWKNYNDNRGYYIIPGAINWNSAAVVSWLRDLMGDPL